MSNNNAVTDPNTKRRRDFPTVKVSDGGNIEVTSADAETLTSLYGVQTDEVARGIFISAMNALGVSGEDYRPLISAIGAELEPRDAAEAMLVTQMTATHVAMTHLCRRMMDQNTTEIRESCERSMTRLSRTYISQLDALKKYRAKAQQTVRVERVTVKEGGQAIVGAMSHSGGSDVEKRR